MIPYSFTLSPDLGWGSIVLNLLPELCSSLAIVGALSLFLSGGAPALLLLAGAALGFLPYNLSSKKHFTRSFLGDTGALFLGYSLAVFSLAPPVFSFGTVFFFAIPVFDLVRVFALRILKKRNPFRADSAHLHHLLLQKGYGKQAVVALCIVYAILFCACGLFLS